MSKNKIECVKISIYEDFAPSIIVPISELTKNGSLQEEIENLEDDDVLYLSKIKLTQKEIDELPEFEGF
jgi:hypothetical protein